MSKSEFIKSWFIGSGVTGREIGYAWNNIFVRAFTSNPNDLVDKVAWACRVNSPCYMSVHSYHDRDVPNFLEKLFLDFDVQNVLDIDLAFNDAAKACGRIKKYANPLMVYTGLGYHVYVFYEKMVRIDDKESASKFQEFMAYQLLEVSNKKLMMTEYPTLDTVVVGDIKRVARVPYSMHESTPSLNRQVLVQPVDDAGSPYDPDLSAFLSNPVGTDVLETVADYVKLDNVARRTGRRIGRNTACPDLVEEVIERGIGDGRRRSITFFIVPNLMVAGYSDEEIAEKCRDFIINSGKSWHEYSYHVADAIRRTRRKIESGERIVRSVNRFLEMFPDLAEHYRKFTS